ncbi:alpha/beta hydrolase family esterase [Alteribacillus bidgolensis]|uniref:Polyhydroxybutyrate depolymerase n=1 Tax=Alteribacillus bidgolensis TaxID=930129 RepID=A0A1G8I8A4_9BACI|nr:PHB depolymerase family esterase [Alteribacillus bidgolensis]SDI15188.1 polyhydroxybutyrate depolymerase [Alteribacillus bidgolensis]
MVAKGELVKETIEIEGVTRNYLYYVPSSLQDEALVPLLFSFHGAGSDANYHSRLTNFHKLAESEQFIVIYPESKQIKNGDPRSKQWNEGKEGNLAYQTGSKDVQFIKELLHQWNITYNIASDQVYATGFSNGASFSLRLALEMPGTFSAVGAVAGPLPKVYKKKETGVLPPLVFVMGNEDPVVPYAEEDAKGEVSYEVDGLLGAKSTVEWWTYQSASSWEIKNERLSPISLHDSTRVERSLYVAEKEVMTAVLYTVKGGGHTWPGGPKVQVPAFGRVSRQIDTSKLLWDSFQLLNQQKSTLLGDE